MESKKEPGGRTHRDAIRSRDNFISGNRRKRATADPIPNVYKEMLAESNTESVPKQGDEVSLLKRRRMGPSENIFQGSTIQAKEQPLPHSPSEDPQLSPYSGINRDEVFVSDRVIQAVTDETSSSEDSDVEWEEVEVSAMNAHDHEVREQQHAESLTIDVLATGNSSKGTALKRRRSVKLVEKRIRILVHKVHLLCLLAHSHLRNAWCNDHGVQASLAPLLSSRTRSYLNPDSTLSQFQRARSFTDGLIQANDQWRTTFTVACEGLTKPYWAPNEQTGQEFKPSTLAEPPITREDFQRASKKLKGSQDLGAQLFCALLRAVGVETRLVCSLQPLSFSGSFAAGTPERPKTSVSLKEARAEEHGKTAEYAQPARRLRAKRISKPSFGPSIFKETAGSKANDETVQVPVNSYPIYWVEVFNSAHQKWVPADPFSTATVGKPSKLEPPFSNSINNLTYAVAFESDGSGKDVTRRYAKAYNAKTRQHRVEMLEGGGKWWRRAMRTFGKAFISDRDQIEDAEFSRKEAEEGLPRNVQDFRHHPYYVLERHLKSNEIIHPMREVGKINAGLAASAKLEQIFRRRDVHTVKSAGKWYRLGREIKAGEQPLKFRRQRQRKVEVHDSNDLDSGNQDLNGTAMYAVFQTQPYIPPPVVRGLVPRNAFGNIDIYTPSMIPAGAVHIRHPEAAKAARLIGVDYADAVTGFKFKGRQGTAVTDGIAVASEFEEAAVAVIEGFEAETKESDRGRLVKEVLRMWKKFLVGLRIVEHVKQYGAEDAEQTLIDIPSVALEETEGGFLPDEAQAIPSHHTVHEISDDLSPHSGLCSGILMDTEPFKRVSDKPLVTRAIERNEHVRKSPAPTAETFCSRRPTGKESELGKLPENRVSEANRNTFESVAAQEPPHTTDISHSSNSSRVRHELIEEDSPDSAERMPNVVSRRSSTQAGEDDSGSLLSHDPEDDEADPEWLTRD